MNRKGGQRGGMDRGSLRRGGERQAKKGYLPEELMSHYRRVQESLSQFQDEENVTNLDHSKSEFLNNVVSSLAEELIQVAQNQTVSTIVEAIIAAASPANLRTLFVSATSDFSVTFLDRFASHVLESLVLRLPEFFDPPTHNAPEDDEDDVAQEKMVASFESFCEFVDKECEVLATHRYGGHVLRAFLESLSGVYVAHELKNRQKSIHGSHPKKDSSHQTPNEKPPEKFRTLFDKYSQKLFRICDYEVHLKDPLFSVLLQVVLMILQRADPDLCQQSCQTLLERVALSCPQGQEDVIGSLPDVVRDPAGSHLLEVVFKVSGEQVARHTYDALLKGRLLFYAVHPAANHVLQTFIASLHSKDVMEQVFEELSKHMEDVMAVGYFGLVVSVAQGCRRLRVKQDDFVTVLMEAFHCKEPQERQKSLTKLIASFTTYEVFLALDDGQDKPAEEAKEVLLTEPINQHGSRLLQEMLQFQKPTHAALGLLDWQPAELRLLCCDPAGSHVVDAYFSSSTVLEKNRDIFLRKLKGLLTEVACSKNGSRCLESVWRSLSLAQRSAVAKELAESERLGGDRFGHFLHRNFKLSLFTTSRKRWQEQQGSLAKRKQMMRELLTHSASQSPAKSKRKEEQEKSEEKEDYIEDKVTALFVRQKKQQEANPPSSSSTKQEPSPDDEDVGSPTRKLPDFPQAEESPKGKKKKKKRDKPEPEKILPIKGSATDRSEEGVRAKRKKRKSKGQTEETESKRSPIKGSATDRSEEGVSAKRKEKKREIEDNESKDEVKKKKKSKKVKLERDE